VNQRGGKGSGQGSGSDFAWLEEFECSEREEVDGWSQLSAAERSKIERLEAELWGLMPCLMEPVAPSSRCKQKLMDRLEPASVGQIPRVEEVKRSRWLLPLAAGLTLLAVGFAASMVGTVREQRGQLAALRAKVEQLSGGPTATVLAADLAAVRGNLGLASSRGVEICPLRPMTVGDDSPEESPYGLLFLAADHQHWYVRVGGLEARPDRYYRVWFETEDGLVPAGNLVGDELELSAPTMPEGTRAVHVSLETEPAPTVPSDQIVLFGNDMIQLL